MKYDDCDERARNRRVELITDLVVLGGLLIASFVVVSMILFCIGFFI